MRLSEDGTVTGSVSRLTKALVLGSAVIGLVVLSGSANAGGNNNYNQNPVAGLPQCGDLFAGASQLRFDAPAPDTNPTGTAPPQGATVAGFDQLVGIIVQGGSTASNVYDGTTGMGGRLIGIRDASGDKPVIDYILVCHTQYADPAMSSGSVNVTFSDSVHHVEVSAVVTVTPTTTAAPTTQPTTPDTSDAAAAVPTTAAPTTTIPTVVEDAQAAAPVPVQPSFTG